ncbi:hypothetical protein [Salibacterium qingdaonense]|uniref:ATP-dependent Lon protease n=1 Tax=Salibacterium qingdaonense TaxID=266892 RepID=A0A1I4QDT2_9BACI|nr:hypothetical protein [Salibacterium qingdaonense]SFM37783.1 hypothetical protein SAMN04488054_14016 [Salibacterium qingdaonense]
MLYLIVSILLSAVLGFVLLMMGYVIGSILAFGIITGCLFRILYLLYDISKRLEKTAPKQDKAKEAYEKYLQGEEENGDRERSGR